MRGAGVAVGVGVAAALTVVAMVAGLSLHTIPQVVEGAHSGQVLALIQAVDHGNKASVAEAVKGVRYTYGEYGRQVQSRPAEIRDIPGSDAGSCKILSIRGTGNLVRANWQCSCCDIALNRRFIFNGVKLTEIQDFYMVFG